MKDIDSMGILIFKKLPLDIIPLVLNWLKQEHVTYHFCGQGLINTLNDLENLSLNKKTTFTHWIAYLDQKPFGYLMTTEIDENDPHFKQWIVKGKKAFTLDLLIGEKEYLGLGLGKRLIREFCLDQFSDFDRVFIDPEAKNSRAIHVYNQVGFEKLGSFIAPWNPTLHWQMKLDLSTLLNYESQYGKKVLETQRMVLRQMTIADIGNLRKILQSEECMRFYPSTLNIDQIKDWIYRQLKRYQENGYGLFACHLKETGEFVGQCGLIKWDDIDGKDEIEIGYLFVQKFWKRGLATEAAMACREYGLNTLKIKRLISLIRPENINSINVAKRNGMQLEKEIVFKGYKTCVFSLTKR